MKIKKVVSACAIKDIRVWKLTAQYVLQHIEAEEYELIVPGSQKEAFRKVTPAIYSIKTDEDYISAEQRQTLADILISKGERSVNWFIQQFLKIAAIRDKQETDVVLIWDADTVPLKKLNFIQPDGSLLFYKSMEHHLPYFATTKKLLGVDRVASFSFISQCLPAYSGWVDEMIEEIEKKSGQQWMVAVCNAITGQGSQFSEYETIGNYALSRHPGKVVFIDRPWFRAGGTSFKRNAPIKNLNALFADFDFVALEDNDFRKRWYEIVISTLKDTARKFRRKN